MTVAATMSDLVLVDELQSNLRQESRGAAKLIVLLRELDSSRGWARLGYSSLHDFCIAALHLSDAEAASRIRVAYLVEKFPLLLPGLSEGRFSLTAIRIMAPVLTEETFADIMRQMETLSTRELENIRARAPQSPVCPARGAIRIMNGGNQPVSLTSEQGSKEMPSGNPASATNTSPATGVSGIPAAQPTSATGCLFPEGAVMQPASNPSARVATEVRLALTLSEEVWEKVLRACDLADLKCSAGQLPAIIERLVDDFLRHHDPARKPSRSPSRQNPPAVAEATPAAATDAEALHEEFKSPDSEGKGGTAGNKRKAEDRTKQSRYIPAKTRREVWARDQGRCAHVDLTTGRRCTCTRGLQYDHLIAFAKGGSSLHPEGLKLTCRAHNRLAADVVFGSEFMQDKIQCARILRRPKSDGRESGGPTTLQS